MNKRKPKYTLNQIGDMVVGIKDDVNALKQDVKDINTRLDGIDARLDYIVKANHLRDNK